jgi:hypothetical protein
MNEQEIKNLFKTNRNELPLVLHKIEVKGKTIEISGKIIEVPIYNTKLFSVDFFYKLITRL